jgi:hypothetical protein
MFLYGTVLNCTIHFDCLLSRPTTVHAPSPLGPVVRRPATLTTAESAFRWAWVESLGRRLQSYRLTPYTKHLARAFRDAAHDGPLPPDRWRTLTTGLLASAEKLHYVFSPFQSRGSTRHMDVTRIRTEAA